MKNLYGALIKFQSQLKPITKTKENPYFHSKYADLAGLWDAVRSSLAENGLAVVQLFDSSPEGDQYLITRLIHVSGECLDSRCKILLSKSDPQSFGSAATYYRRYGFSTTLGLTTEEDDDGNAAVTKPPSEDIGFKEKYQQSSSPNAEFPKCPVCGSKMFKSKFESGPAFYCPNKKNHAVIPDELPF